MNTDFKKIKEEKFLKYFLKKEKDFLMNFNIEAYKNDDFNFYMSWFIHAINYYMNKNYDIEDFFNYMFCNNDNLNIVYLPYILNPEFREKVMQAITEYKQQYNVEQIFEI